MVVAILAMKGEVSEDVFEEVHRHLSGDHEPCEDVVEKRPTQRP